jgi:drug/metabolite transporter (DMT)-like permease
MTSSLTIRPASRRESWVAFGALVLGALAMAISPNFVRWAEVGPFTSAFWRVFLALPALHVWMRLSERGLDPAAVAKGSFSKPIWFSGLAFTGDLLCWHQSIVTTNVADATFFATTAPVWVVVFGWLLLGQRVGRETLAGLAFCMMGAGALLAETLHGHPTGVLGDLEGLATGVFFGLYFLTVQAARRTVSAARVTFESSVITAVILFGVAAVAERHMFPQTLAGVLALLALAWISHAGGQGLLAIALGRLSATFSSLVIFLEAIAAAGLAWLLLGEPVSRIQALGGLLILIGIYVARPRAKG